MKLTKILICLLIFWTGTLSASPYFSFKKYQVEDGLSHNTVWCALQDSYGFIWLGTSDGLNRYDGRGNKVYRNVLNDKFSLENNFVEALIEVDKNIWVGTNSGLYIYDRDTDRFSCFDKTTQYNVYISSEIKKIIKTENGLIWIATLGQGFFIYDPKTEVLTQNSVQTSFVWDLCQSADRKRVYISSLQEGLLCFDENGKFLRTYEISLDINASDSYKVNCIQNIDGEIWIGAGSNLLSRLDERTEAIDNYSGSAFNFGAVHCLLKYTDKELLVGTDNGLYLFDQNTNTTRQNKISRLIQKELSEIFMLQTKAMKGVLVSVSACRISPDLSICRVYLSIFPSQQSEEIMKNINGNMKAIRYELGTRVRHQLRIIPELKFFVDDSLDYIENIDKLLKE